MKIIKIEIATPKGAGCSNGIYRIYTATFDNGYKHEGSTCLCGYGCSNTEILPTEGETFPSYEHFKRSVRKRQD